MNVVRMLDLHSIVSNEKNALSYLCSKMKPNDKSCPRCRYRKHYAMGRSNLRCSRCRTDYNPLGNTCFGLIKIPLTRWLVLIKLFELSVSARKAATEAAVSYPTALKAFDVIRRTILNNLAKKDRKLKGVIEADESYFGGKRKGRRGRGASGKTIVFGILERRRGKVSVEIVDDVSADSLMRSATRKVRRGSIVYTDTWKSYDSLMFCGYRHTNIDHSKVFSRGKVHINSIEGFWSFAKERLMKHHGISPKKFVCYIKEMEWRYNNKDRNLFDMIVNYMLGVIGL